MITSNKQENISQDGHNNKVILGDDNSRNFTQSKLSTLFERLKQKFESEDTISKISSDLKKYIDTKDTIGLEEKLALANKSHLFEDFSWLKQEFYKKLVLYQNYEPAQEIFAFILAIVLEKYRNLIRPQIRAGKDEGEILKSISDDIINPIMTLIQQEGCYDIMGLSSTEIEGMFHYLTGNCHINWKL